MHQGQRLANRRIAQTREPARRPLRQRRHITAHRLHEHQLREFRDRAAHAAKAKDNFKDVLGRAERITWRVEDLIGEGKTLDFAKPFMPESLARVEGLAFLSPAEKRMLNQIRGHAYLSLFGVIEEFYSALRARPHASAYQR